MLGRRILEVGPGLGILTGALPFEHGVRDNIGFVLGTTRPTLADAFCRSSIWPRIAS